jgi:hypothetical protein
VENPLCLDFAARRTDENMKLGNCAEAWNAADKLHYLAASLGRIRRKLQRANCLVKQP